MITVAKNAGFCFGVKRAVDIIENKLNAKQNIFCIGEIIHNKIFMDSLKKRGVVVIEPENFEQIPINSDAVIRTHGVSKQVYGNLDKNKIAYIDATCPFVEKIHKIAAEQSSDGSICIILGDKNHPEVRGIMSFAKFGGEVFDNANDALKYIKNITLTGKSFFVVSQTTFDTREWKFFDNNLRNLYTNAKIFDTICSVTENRQNEALSLAKSADLTVVVGGKTSSNTAKLFSIATDNCKNAIWVENGDSIYEYRDIIKKAKNMVIIAGASTPSVIIQEVNNIMAEILNEELSFAEMLDQSFKTLNTGERVVGVVSAVSSAEIKVDLGTKHTGILPYDEIVNEGSIDLEKEFHIGDSIEVMCLKFSDVEGTVLLSKKRLDENKNLTAISNAAESGEILHGTVKEIVKGGVVVYINGIRVFVPASQCGPEGLDLETLKNAKVPVKIFEYNAQRKRAVGSIRFAKRSERKEKLDELYASLTIGQKITGTIHSIMNYGIFVNIGAADGMVHISELFWGRTKNPADYFKVGDKIDVYVKSVDRENERISLGYKTEENNPWNVFLQTYKVGDVINVTVVSIMTFGAFAEIIPGVDGLIHSTQISEKRVANPATVMKIGDKADVKITAVDVERKRISLSVKAVIAPEIYEAELSASEAAEEAKAVAAAESADAEQTSTESAE